MDPEHAITRMTVLIVLCIDWGWLDLTDRRNGQVHHEEYLFDMRNTQILNVKLPNMPAADWFKAPSLAENVLVS